jgi:hypothetical protein
VTENSEYVKLTEQYGKTVVVMRASAFDEWPKDRWWGPDHAEKLADDIRELAQRAREENDKPKFILGAIYGDSHGYQYVRMTEGFVGLTLGCCGEIALDEDTNAGWRSSLKLVTSEANYKF